MCRMPQLCVQSFAERISTLTKEQIKFAAENMAEGIKDTSDTANFLHNPPPSYIQNCKLRKNPFPQFNLLPSNMNAVEDAQIKTLT